MSVVRVDEIGAHEGQTVTLRGWLAARRSSGKVHFLQVRDGAGTIQCVMGARDVPEETFAAAAHLPQETALEVTGAVRADARSPLGYELGVQALRILHVPTTDYPITPKEHGTGFLLEHRHLWLRSSRQHAVLRVRAEVIRACREYLDDHGFVGFDAPILTPTSCEGTTTLFPVEYFGETAYLTQSGQLYGEAGALAFGKVYVFGPTFRAEKSKTRRHLTEFWMVEPEMAFADLDDDMALAEDFLAHVVARVVERRRLELRTLERDIAALERVRPPFPRITYDDAIDALRAAGVDIAWGDDLGAEAETTLSQRFDRPVMVHRYPAGGQGLLHEGRPGRPATRALRRRARTGGLRRDHRRRAARGRPRGARSAARGARPLPRAVRVVPRPAPLRLGAARRLRHGHRTCRRLALRPAPRARDDPIPPHAGAPASLT